MKAVILNEHGGIDKLKYEEIAEPVQGKDEVLVKVKACGVNHLDIWVRQGVPGRTVKFPHICGSDIAGEVTASSGKSFTAGDKVMVYPALHCGECDYCKQGLENLCRKFMIIGGFGDADGGYAEYVRVPERNLIRIPGWLSYDEAATLGVSYLTAWNMLERAGAKEGTNLLVYAAGSGLGTATIQLAKAMRAKVITTVGSDAKVAQARSLSPDLVVNRKSSDIVGEAMKFTNNDGVDVVIDHVGAQTWGASLKCLKPQGRMMVCGATTGDTANVDIRTLYAKQVSITGASLGTKSQLLSMLDFMDEHKIKPLIDSTFRLSEAASAQSKMERSEQFGKIILKT